MMIPEDTRHKIIRWKQRKNAQLMGKYNAIRLT